MSISYLIAGTFVLAPFQQHLFDGARRPRNCTMTVCTHAANEEIGLKY